MLSNSECLAVRSSSVYDGGLVISAEPLRTDELLQVVSFDLHLLVTYLTYTVKNIHIVSQIFCGEFFYIVTELVSHTFVSVNWRNNEAWAIIFFTV